MTQCLTKHMRIKTNLHGFSLVEILMAVAFSVLLLTGVYGFYSASSQSYSSGISGQTLQDAADIILSKISEGETEANVVYRLSTAVSYMIPNGAGNSLYTCGGIPQAAPCNINNTTTAVELYYCQDSPCTYNDATARWYYLNATGTSVIYHHPTNNGKTIEEAIYTAPAGSGLSLRFSPAAVNTPSNVVEIDVALRQNLSTNLTNSRLASTSGSGAASTFILLRSHI